MVELAQCKALRSHVVGTLSPRTLDSFVNVLVSQPLPRILCVGRSWGKRVRQLATANSRFVLGVDSLHSAARCHARKRAREEEKAAGQGRRTFHVLPKKRKTLLPRSLITCFASRRPTPTMVHRRLARTNEQISREKF